MITICICDDNPVQLHSMFMNIKDLTIEINCNIVNFLEASKLISFLEDELCDILIIDIALQTHNGIDIAKKFAYKEMQVIFVSGNIYYASDIYDVEHIYFIVKPVDEQKLENALNKAINKLGDTENKSISIKRKGSFSMLPVNHILYVESMGHKLRIYTMTDNYETYGNIEDMLVSLGEKFFQCHKSYAINMNSIKNYEKTCFILKNGQQIPISQSKMKIAKQAFFDFLGESI